MHQLGDWNWAFFFLSVADHKMNFWHETLIYCRESAFWVFKNDEQLKNCYHDLLAVWTSSEFRSGTCFSVVSQNGISYRSNSSHFIKSSVVCCLLPICAPRLNRKWKVRCVKVCSRNCHHSTTKIHFNALLVHCECEWVCPFAWIVCSGDVWNWCISKTYNMKSCQCFAFACVKNG